MASVGTKTALFPNADTRDLLPPPAHLLRERIPNVRVGARLRLRNEMHRIHLRLGFDAGSLGSSFGGRDNRVCFCIGSRL
jgi:hypothetical protein